MLPCQKIDGAGDHSAQIWHHRGENAPLNIRYSHTVHCQYALNRQSILILRLIPITGAPGREHLFSALNAAQNNVGIAHINR